MEEKVLYFIWKYKLYDTKKLTCTNGKLLQILNHGMQNHNAGPDFFNAKIKIDDTLWAGNVEMHLKSSDWNKHKHQNDKAYNNVILHVVFDDDIEIFNENKDKVPALKLSLNQALTNKYKELLENENKLSCGDDIKTVEQFRLKMWFDNILFERLNEKTKIINEKLEINKNNWEEVFYQMMARNFGFNLNAEPFERLARSLPLKYLAKHHNNLMQIEALLYGQAGFLNNNYPDMYFQDLKKEYLHLQRKFKLRPIEKHSWKFLRSRPSNFPFIRISQFANLIYQSSTLFSKIINANNIKEIQGFFEINASEFWSTHYTFEKKSEKKEKKIGKTSINNIIINTIVPFTFLYGNFKDNQTLKDKAITFLESINPENNYITRMWNAVGIKANNAFLSQALIQQTKNYCQKNKCLDCGIGSEILKQSYTN
ncbi:MAG: hypothetical protein B6I20_11840 [Bacteroidetes bacterium 4572_117]|nr:MAG: hypothetical protein B6I20_11840 [Bacteroidetes bacterium 4572_117]